MKSLHIACAAIAATGATLAAVAMLGDPDRVMGQAYDRMLAASEGLPRHQLVAAAHAPGSEHFWLTRAADGDGGHISRASTAAPSLADIKQAIAASGDLDAERLEILSVQDIAHATIGAAAPVTRSSLLVTARIGASAQQPARVVRFVLDGASALPQGRAL